MNKQQRQLELVTDLQDKNSRKIYLDGRKALVHEEILETFEVVKEKDMNSGLYTGKVVSSNLIETKVKKRKEFPLKEVSIKRLTTLRASGEAGFVLKEHGKYYYAKIDKNISLISAKNLLDSGHMCALNDGVCKHISSGCAKVDEGSSCIEKYDWIPVGYETFNAAADCFVVCCCQHYEMSVREKPHLSQQERTERRIGLAQFVWPDVETITEVQRRKERNKGN